MLDRTPHLTTGWASRRRDSSNPARHTTRESMRSGCHRRRDDSLRHRSALDLPALSNASSAHGLPALYRGIPIDRRLQADEELDGHRCRIKESRAFENG